MRPLELNVQLIINTMFDRSCGLLGRKMSSTTSELCSLQHQHHQYAHDGPKQCTGGNPLNHHYCTAPPFPLPPVTRDKADYIATETAAVYTC